MSIKEYLDFETRFTKIQKWVIMLVFSFFVFASFHLLFLKAEYDIEQQSIIKILVTDKQVTVEKTENLLLKLGQFEEKTKRLEEKIDQLTSEKQEKDLRKANFKSVKK